MEDNKSNIAEPVKGISTAATIGSLTAILVSVVKAVYPLGDPASPEYFQDKNGKISVSQLLFLRFLIHGLVLLFKYYFVTPKEEVLRRKLNADLKEYEKHSRY